MARESEQQPPGDDFIDKPAPDAGYLWFLHLAVGGPLLLDIVVTWYVGKAEPVACSWSATPS